MSGPLLRAFDVAREETSAWLGKSEHQAYAALHCTNELEDYWKGRIEPKLAKKIQKAFAKKRELTLIFASPRQTSFDPIQVLTIDRVRGRVDRALSSDELLRDPWYEMPAIRTADLKTLADPDSRDNLFSGRVLQDVVFSVVMLGTMPAMALYQHGYLARQRQFERKNGYSRHFASIVAWFSPMLEPEMRILLKSSLQSLWKHEQWMKRQVDLVEAELSLCKANLHVSYYTPDLEYREPYEPGPTTGDCEWLNEDGVRIAHATLFVDQCGDTPGEVIIESLCVFGSYFRDADARRLATCFKKKIVRDKRMKEEKK